MADGALPKPLQDLAAVFVMSMVAGGILLGWLNNRGRPRRGDGAPPGDAGDDAHHHGWWGGDAGDGGHHGGDGGDAGH